MENDGKWSPPRRSDKGNLKKETYCKTFPPSKKSNKGPSSCKIIHHLHSCRLQGRILGVWNETNLILHDFWGNTDPEIQMVSSGCYLGPTKEWACLEETSDLLLLLFLKCASVLYRLTWACWAWLARSHIVGFLPTKVITFQTLISCFHLLPPHVKLPCAALMSDIQCGLLRDLLRVPLN